MKKKILLIILMSIILSSFVSADFINHVVGAWKLNATSGNQLIDSTGYADMRAINGNSTGVGKIGLSNNSFNHSNLYSYKLNESVDSKTQYKAQNFSIVINYWGNNVGAGDFWFDMNYACPSGGASDGFQFDTNGAAEFRIVIGGSVYTFTGGLAKLNATTWNNIILTRSPSGMILYINGLQVATAGANSYTSPSGAGCFPTIGAYGRGDGALNSRTDEVMYINMTITSADALAIHNNATLGIFYPYISGSPPPPPDGNATSIFFTNDTTANNSVLIYPNAVITMNTTASNFGIIPTTNHSVYNSTNGIVYRMTNVSNFTRNSFNNFTPGIYYFNATANNLTFTNKTETRIITVISNQSLVIGSNSIVNNTVLYYVGNNFTFNVTTLFFNNRTLNITFNIYNSTGGLIQTNSRYGNTSFNLSYSGLNVGTYYINATATDGVVSNFTQTRIFYIYEVISGSFLNPQAEQKINRSLNITWNNSRTNPNVVPILNYTVQLLNRTGSLLFNLSNSVLNYTQWNTYQYNLSIDNYTLRLITIDNNSKTSSTDKNINITRNTYLNITAKSLSGATINNFTISAYNALYNLNITLNTTSGYLEIDHIRGLIELDIDAEGFSLNENTSSASINVTSQNQSYQFTLYQTNTINFTFYNQSGNTIMTQNVTFDLIGSFSSYTNVTTNGNIVIPLITPDDYLLRYTSNGFTTRFYTITVLNRSYQNLDLYLLSSNLAYNFTVYVVNQVLNPVEGAIVKNLKYDLTTNNYFVQEIGVTDVTGKTTFTVTYNNEYYKQVVEYPSGTLKKITNPDYIDTPSVVIPISLGDTDVLEDLISYDGINGILVFNNATDNFRFDWSDTGLVASEYCLDVYRMTGLAKTLYNNTCSAGSSAGTILLGVANGSGYLYYAEATYFENSIEKFLTSLYYEYPTASADVPIASQYGLFIQLLLTLGMTSLVVLNIGLAMILAPFSLIIGKILGWNAFTWAGLLAIQVVGITLAIISSMRR